MTTSEFESESICAALKEDVTAEKGWTYGRK